MHNLTFHAPSLLLSRAEIPVGVQVDQIDNLVSCFMTHTNEEAHSIVHGECSPFTRLIPTHGDVEREAGKS